MTRREELAAIREFALRQGVRGGPPIPMIGRIMAFIDSLPAKVGVFECIECPVHRRADKAPISHWAECDLSCLDSHAYWERAS